MKSFVQLFHRGTRNKLELNTLELFTRCVRP